MRQRCQVAVAVQGDDRDWPCTALLSAGIISVDVASVGEAAPVRFGRVDTALVIACISGVVALATAGYSGWIQLRVKKLERQNKEEERRSEAKVVLDLYRGPLLDAAWQLADRLDNIRNRGFFAYLSASNDRAQDAKRTTLFRFAYYLGWREYVRTKVQLLRFENEEDTRLAAAFLNDATRVLASDQLDGHWAMLWGDEQRGIGELMIDQSPGSSFIVRGHAAFQRDYDKTFAEWMERFADDLFSPAVVKGSDRLRLLQWALYGLVRQLDEEGAYPGGFIERSADEISRTSSHGTVTTHELTLRKHLAALKPPTSRLPVPAVTCRLGGRFATPVNCCFPGQSWFLGVRLRLRFAVCALRAWPLAHAVVGPRLVRATEVP